MADQSFGVKQLNLLGSGVPTIDSPSDINLNASVDSNVNVNVFYDDRSGAGNFSFTDLTLTANTWHHYALVRRGQRVYAYLDGIAITSTKSTRAFEVVCRYSLILL